MNIRARINVIWVVALIVVTMFLLIVHSGVYKVSTQQQNALAMLVFLALAFIMIPGLFIMEARLLSTIYSPADSGESILQIVFIVISACAVAPTILGTLAYMSGGTIIFVDILGAASYICLIYVRWRSHVRWEKLFLG